ncbi:hypothetical protein KC340_g18051 [Hortaea werneckii]|nr:hypothetical protein KC339_g18236 [Hortaea werneckii]KAI7287827.1 hypothetical protein KC340_g18051 [Hortaea werneckii]KAI7372331.1 hypothetical protein KC328_g17320 [Hortaea werneckii]
MPPANTPETSSQSRPRSPTPPLPQSLHQARPLTPLSYLSSPAPDLASTLHPAASTQPMSAADEADEANSAFLRDALEVLERDPQQAIDDSNTTRSITHIDPLRDPRRRPLAEGAEGGEAAAQMSHRRAEGETSEDLSRRERLQRVLARLNRLHEPPSAATAAMPARGEREAYSNRTPEPHMQSLYDWAPAGRDRDSDMAGAEEEGQGGGAPSQQQQQHGSEGRELDAILRELRRQQQAPLAETGGSAEILRMLSQSQAAHRRRSHPRGNGSVEQSHGHENTLAPLRSNTLDIAERRERLRERERRRRENEWVSLRARAALQRSREASADSSGASPSATDRMLRYVLERERRGVSEEEDRARGTGWFRPSPPTPAPGHDGLAQYQQRIPNAMRHSHEASWMLPPPSTGSDDFIRDQDRAERVEAFRRGYLADNVPGGAGAGPPRLPRISTPPVIPSMSTNAAWASGSTSSGSTAFLENAMKYLSDLRSCHSYEDALSAAIDHGLATKEFFADKHEDFIMDLHSNEEDSEERSFPWSSWLQPGTVFDGHQYAMNGTNGASIAHNIEQINPYSHSSSSRSAFDHPPGSTRVAVPPAPFDATRPWLSHVPPSHPSLFDKRSTTSTPDDQWPVRVVINSVDPEKMTLQGTMEAYDVPQHPQPHHILTGGSNNHSSSSSNQSTTHRETTTSPPCRPRAGKKHAPITTFLEGQILSLNPHTFLTPPPPPSSHHASPSNPYPSTYPHAPPSSHPPSSSSSPINPNKPPGSGGPTIGPHPTLPMNETPYTTLPTGPVFPPTTPRIDARNWARLPPFRDLGRRGPAERGRDGGREGEEGVFSRGDGDGGRGGGEAGKDEPSFQEREGEQGVEGAGVGRGGVGRGLVGHEEKVEMEMARLLLSKSRWKGEVMGRFVCMRWKEKCFVRNFPSASSSSSSSSARKRGKRDSEGLDDIGRPKEMGEVGPDHHDEEEVDSAPEDDQQQYQQQQGHGLTISGFYYIVLDRQTGCVEGLYYDPASTPFQRLKLRGCSSSQIRSRRLSGPRGGGGGGAAAGGDSSARNGDGSRGGNGGGMVWPAVGFA